MNFPHAIFFLFFLPHSLQNPVEADIEEREVLPFAVVESILLSIVKAISSACALEGAMEGARLKKETLVKLDGQSVDYSLASCILEGAFKSEKLENIEIKRTKKLNPDFGKTRNYLQKIWELVEKERSEFLDNLEEEVGADEQEKLGNFVICIKFFQYAYAILWESLKVPIAGKIDEELVQTGSRKLVRLEPYLEKLAFLSGNARKLVDVLKMVIFGTEVQMGRKVWKERFNGLKDAEARGARLRKLEGATHLMPLVAWEVKDNIGKLTFKEAPVVGIEDGLQLISDLLELVKNGHILSNLNLNWDVVTSKSTTSVKGLLELVLTAIKMDIGHAEFWSNVNKLGEKWTDSVAGAKLLSLVAIIGENLGNLKGQKSRRVLLMDAKDPLSAIYNSILTGKMEEGPMKRFGEEFGLAGEGGPRRFSRVLGAKSQQLLGEANKAAVELMDLEVPESWRQEQFRLDFQMRQMRQFGQIKDDSLSLNDAQNLLTFINGIGPVRKKKLMDKICWWILPELPEYALDKLLAEVNVATKYSPNAVHNIKSIVALAKSQVDKLGDFFDVTRKNERKNSRNEQTERTRRTVLEEYIGLRQLMAIGSVLAGKLGKCQSVANVECPSGLSMELDKAKGLGKEFANLTEYFQKRFASFKVKVHKLSKSEKKDKIDTWKRAQGPYDKKNEEELKEELKLWLTTTEAIEQEMAPYLHVAVDF